MKATQAMRPFLPHALRRAEALVPEGAIDNGTSLAAATASIVAAVLARQPIAKRRDPEKAVAALSDADILEVRDAVEELVSVDDHRLKRVVDFGKPVELQAGYGTGITIVRDRYAPVRDRPGLHPFGEAEYGPDLPGAGLLRERICAAMATLPEMDVSPPTPDDIRIEQAYKYRDRVSVPMRGGPGRTFLHQENIQPSESLLDAEIDDIAATMREKAANLWAVRDQVDEAYENLLLRIGPMLERAQAEGVRMSLAGINVHMSAGTPHLRFEFDVLGNDLQPGNWTAYVMQNGTIEAVVANQIAVQRRRAKLLAEAQANGARGRIDLVTLNALRDLVADPAAALRELGTNRRITLQLGRRGKKRDTFGLSWRNGTVMSSFALAENIVWSYGRVSVRKKSFPQAVLDQLPGKPVAALLDHPYLDPQRTIRSVSGSNGGYLTFNVGAESVEFDPATGKILD